MHKSDSFKNLAVRPTLNNIPVLPASRKRSIGGTLVDLPIFLDN